MSRFAVKIYAVLLIMGAAPLIASAVLLSEVLTFNKNLQDEAVETLDDVSHFHRAWATSEADRVSLIGANLSLSPELRLPIATNEERIQQALERELGRYGVLVRAVLYDEGAELMAVGDQGERGLEGLKLRTRRWRVGQTVQPNPPDSSGRVLELTFGIDMSLSDRYEDLGQRRQLHRGLSALEGEKDGSLSEVYTKFYYIMLVLVVVLTVGFALLITTPLSRRLGRLTAATERVAKGELGFSIPVQGKDELSQLTKQFNEMVEELGEARKAVTYLERMSAWQEVARRLAHEIKNPLTPLLLAVQQLDKTFDKYYDRPERYRQIVTEVVEIVTEEVDTLRKLVREFSEFARLPSASPEPREVWEFVTQTLRSNPQFYEMAKINEIEGPVVTARLDPLLMRRVLVNIVQNAIEAAVEAGNAPIIEVSLEVVGENARIRVVDNGTGLPAEGADRVFDPYFTTKAEGTGLGLAIVRKIVIDHGGDIRLLDRTDGTKGVEARIEVPAIPLDQVKETLERKREAEEALMTPSSDEETDEP
ncbi:MAG: hypothetical protein AUK47_02745 [Deltaproteobacteria bacterium CG2_30_63_29]|nr:MAG: hypothetical protein AUK47_02745 [Deltaproteobacteria bacterium CG2_30_63_29]